MHVNCAERRVVSMAAASAGEAGGRGCLVLEVRGGWVRGG